MRLPSAPLLALMALLLGLGRSNRKHSPKGIVAQFQNIVGNLCDFTGNTCTTWCSYKNSNTEVLGGPHCLS